MISNALNAKSQLSNIFIFIPMRPYGVSLAKCLWNGNSQLLQSSLKEMDGPEKTNSGSLP